MSLRGHLSFAVTAWLGLVPWASAQLSMEPPGFKAWSDRQAWKLSGELRQWHPLTLTFRGPWRSEQETPNPFRDHRLEVTFQQGGQSFRVPGYFAADGKAAETSAEAGNQWRVHFCPPTTGTWNFTVSFRSGPAVATNPLAHAGNPTSFHGTSGTFVVDVSDKTAPDFRAKGMIQYVGSRYFQHQNGDWFLKAGPNSPENFLAYADFDGTSAGNVPLHQYSPHLTEYASLGGGPTWQGGKGQGILGALNYIASRGMNVVYFLTMNIDGDGDDVWPWTSSSERFRYDVSKLDQWERVFTHMDQLGLMLHFVTQEVESIYELDSGQLGPERRLYYREMVARFGHHLGVVWNLGEENSAMSLLEERREYATYLRSIDPYDHIIALHTYHDQQEMGYADLLGFGDFEHATLSVGENPWYKPDASHDESIEWIDRSGMAGRQWIVTVDEIGTNRIGVSPDGHPDDPGHHKIRQTRLWPTFFSGAAGVEWYFGSDYALDGGDDLTTEDWATRDEMWRQTKFAVDFFHDHLPFTEMDPDRTLASNSTAYVFAKVPDVYAVYLPDGDSTLLTLPAGNYSVEWYDPLAGGILQSGSVSLVAGGGDVSIGDPPPSFVEDAVALVRLVP